MAVISEQASALIGIQHMVEEVVTSLQRVTLSANSAASSLLKVDDLGHGIVGTHFLLDSLFGQGRGGGGGGEGGGGGTGGGFGPGVGVGLPAAKSPKEKPQPLIPVRALARSLTLETGDRPEEASYGLDPDKPIMRAARRNTRLMGNGPFSDDGPLSKNTQMGGESPFRRFPYPAFAARTQLADDRPDQTTRLNTSPPDFGLPLAEQGDPGKLGLHRTSHSRTPNLYLEKNRPQKTKAGKESATDAKIREMKKLDQVLSPTKGKGDTLAAQSAASALNGLGHAAHSAAGGVRGFKADLADMMSARGSAHAAKVGVNLLANAGESASPDAYGTLLGSFKLLAAEIGVALVPTMVRASAKIQDFSKWVGSISDKNKGRAASLAMDAVGLAAFRGYAPGGEKLTNALGGQLASVFTGSGPPSRTYDPKTGRGGGAGGLAYFGGMAAGAATGAGIGYQMADGRGAVVGAGMGAALMSGHPVGLAIAGGLGLGAWAGANSTLNKGTDARNRVLTADAEHENAMPVTEEGVRRLKTYEELFGGVDKKEGLARVHRRRMTQTERLTRAVEANNKAPTPENEKEMHEARRSLRELDAVELLERPNRPGEAANRPRVMAGPARLNAAVGELGNISALAMHLQSRTAPSFYSVEDIGRSIQLHALGDSPLQEQIKILQQKQLDAMLKACELLSDIQKKDVMARAGLG